MFLAEDGIPWNNNMAERAIRQLAVQRKISGSFFKGVVSHYLLLLAISVAVTQSVASRSQASPAP